MSVEDRVRWDTIYFQQTHLAYPDPDPFLFEYAPPLVGTEELRALDLAGGVGQNGLWLAEQGYTVDIIDISRMALLQGRSETIARGLRNVNLLQYDLDSVELKHSYHLICVFRFLKRDLFSQIRAAVAPGGRVVYETFNSRYLQIKPQFNPAYLLEPGELAGYFADWKILHKSELRYISRVVAIKPLEENW